MSSSSSNKQQQSLLLLDGKVLSNYKAWKFLTDGPFTVNRRRKNVEGPVESGQESQGVGPDNQGLWVYERRKKLEEKGGCGERGKLTARTGGMRGAEEEEFC